MNPLRRGRAGIGTVLLAALAACASPPEHVAPPDVACGSGADDAGSWTTDPCAAWTACVGNEWSATYTGGTCGEDGRCVFAGPPVWHHCEAGCILQGPYGRCSHVGATPP